MPNSLDFRRTQSVCSSFMQIHRHIYLALYDQVQAKTMANQQLNQNYLIVPLHQSQTDVLLTEDNSEDNSQAFTPSTLAQIYKFDQILRDISRKNVGAKLVFCSGTERLAQSKIAFLFGCHLLMTHCVDLESVIMAFAPMNHIFGVTEPSSDSFSVWSCWRALACAKQMDWLDFWEVFDTGDCSDCCIKIEEFLHYARWAMPFLVKIVSTSLRGPTNPMPAFRSFLAIPLAGSHFDVARNLWMKRE